MPDRASTANLDVSAAERIDRTLATIERIINAVGEHPDCELKTNWIRNTPYNKAEVIKDILAIANSNIAPGNEKYIVVGVDEQTRAFTGCKHEDYDEAALRQLLDSYLDRVPEFELLKLRASDGSPIVVVRIPHQTGRPFVAKATITDDRGRIYLKEGDIYYKPGGPQTGGTGKQRVTSRDALVAMLDLDALAQAAATERINQMLPIIRLEERTRLGGSGVIPAMTATDDEFEAYVEQALISNNENIFRILLEKLRDRTVTIWERCSEMAEQISNAEIQQLKEDFLPAMRRLMHLGLLLVKFSAPVSLFSRIADQLVDILSCSRLLQRVTPSGQREMRPSSLAEHTTYSVPAVESLLAAYLLAGYSLKKASNIQYFSTLFPWVVSFGERGDSQRHRILLFWPYYWEGGPRVDMDLLVAERYSGDDRIETIVGRGDAIPRVARQADCLLEWHSFLSFAVQGKRPAGSPETLKYLADKYPKGALDHFPFFIRERLDCVIPTLELIADNLITGKKNLFALDEGLCKVLEGIELNRREALFGNYLIYIQGEQSERMFQSGRFPYSVYWPKRLQEIIEKALAQESKESSLIG